MATRRTCNVVTGVSEEVNLTPEEEAEAAVLSAAESAYLQTAPMVRLSADETERAACKIDAQILPLVNQTKAEWITWAGANFPSLTATERTRLGILFWVVSVGVRRSIRNGS